MKPAHLDGVHVVPVRGVPEIVRGDDLAAVLVPYLREADVRDGAGRSLHNRRSCR
jgi:hypothetical protein